MANPSQNYGASPAIWDHSVNCYQTQVKVSCHTKARQAGTPVLAVNRDGLPVSLSAESHPSNYLTLDSNLTGSRMNDLIIASLT